MAVAQITLTWSKASFVVKSMEINLVVSVFATAGSVILCIAKYQEIVNAFTTLFTFEDRHSYSKF